jgi:hypothetical protein
MDLCHLSAGNGRAILNMRGGVQFGSVVRTSPRCQIGLAGVKGSVSDKGLIRPDVLGYRDRYESGSDDANHGSTRAKEGWEAT